MNCLQNLNKCKAICCKIININGKIIYAPCKALNSDDTCSLHGTDKKPEICRRFDENHTEGYYIPSTCIYNKKCQKSD